MRMPIERDEAAASQLFLFEGEPQGPAYGDPMVVEIKTRGPEAFKRWRTLGAERSHPASVAQAAFYTLGQFGDLRDAVIATMDTGDSHLGLRASFPPHRLERALQDACRLARRGGKLTIRSRAGRTRMFCLIGTLLPQPAGSAGAAHSWRSACRERRKSSDESQRLEDRGGERRGGAGRGGGLHRGSRRNQGAGEGQAHRACAASTRHRIPSSVRKNSEKVLGQPTYLEAKA